MHSSRMRTGRALTVWGGGWLVYPRIIFGGGKEIEKKKKKKFGDPPRKLETPPENFTHTHTPPSPPRKFQNPPPPPPPRGQTHTYYLGPTSLRPVIIKRRAYRNSVEGGGTRK